MLIKTYEAQPAWEAETLLENDKFHYCLSVEDIDEIEKALKQVKNIPVAQVKQADFPLEALKEKLRNVSQELEFGLGISYITGLPVGQFSQDELYKTFWGISTHLGTAVAQDPQGTLIGDIKYAGVKIGEPTARGINTKEALNMHTDACDVIAMFCLQPAQQGGESLTVSSIAIHNEILEKCPDLLEVLYEPFYYQCPQWENRSEQNYYPLPIFSVYHNYFASQYLRARIENAQNLDGVPKLTEKQIEALGVLDSIAQDPKFYHTTLLEPGHILLLNNFVTYHTRREFKSSNGDNCFDRHLLRLWLSTRTSRPLAPEFKSVYRNVEAGAIRGGFPLR